MRHPTVFSPWLSVDMAHALAAMWPPLKHSDVVRAADKLTAGVMATYVIDDLQRSGTDRVNSRRVVEALGALHDALQ
ncbi:MAG: hypothetical protein LC797_22845 [Chloroflexi bacterium]|nr:hypothetical protein [Chloroflexota bacterium]